MNEELAALVDTPLECMDVEHKSWIDLNDHKVRANLARHIAGLANFGGGVLVLGINDDGSSSGTAPADFVITHDVIASIAQKYLDPAVHCDVRWVRSKIGVEHPVIQVPSHGATPICAKANGPDEKGKPAGIVLGAYYVRKPGPKTEAIVSAAEWRDVIRRCALHDRNAILSALSAALTPVETEFVGDRLNAFASAAERAFISHLEAKTFRTPISDCRIHLSYQIETNDGELLSHGRLVELLRQVGWEVDVNVQSGWSLFHVFNSSPMAPYWQTDSSSPNDEFLETNLVDPGRTLGLDFWRVSPEGIATIIREFWEDTEDYGLPPRATLNPKILMRTLGELVRHAEALSGKFTQPLRVRFLCKWVGLEGRQLHVPNGIPFHSGSARVNAALTTGTWAVGDLGSRLPEIVAQLGARVARALDWTGLTPDRVAQEAPRWREL